MDNLCRYFACVIVLVLAAAGGLYAGSVELSGERWEEDAFGVSLAPPINSTRYEYTRDGAAVRFVTPDTTIISLAIRATRRDVGMAEFEAYQPTGGAGAGFGDGYQSKANVLRMNLGDGVSSIPEAIDNAIHQVGVLEPTAILLEQNGEMQVADRAAAMMNFKIPTERHGVWHLTIGMIQLDPKTFAILEMRSDPQMDQTAAQLFAAVFESIRVLPVKTLNERRGKLIEATEAWRKEMDAAKRREAMVPEQWYRIVEADRDMGYIRINQSEGVFTGSSGVEMTVQSRVHLPLKVDRPGGRSGGKVIAKVQDTQSRFFLSDDGQTEFWQVRTTVRPLNNNAGKGAADPSRPLVYSRSDTGVRDGKTVTAIHGEEQVKWEIPQQGYLSQLELYMLPQLVDLSRVREMAFYSYDSPAQTLTLHTARIEPQDRGGWRMYLRPSLTSYPEIMTFDANGKLQQWVPIVGRVVIPSSRQEIGLKWGVAARD